MWKNERGAALGKIGRRPRLNFIYRGFGNTSDGDKARGKQTANPLSTPLAPLATPVVPLLQRPSGTRIQLGYAPEAGSRGELGCDGSRHRENQASDSRRAPICETNMATRRLDLRTSGSSQHASGRLLELPAGLSILHICLSDNIVNSEVGRVSTGRSYPDRWL
jgi:hypothetical protein